MKLMYRATAIAVAFFFGGEMKVFAVATLATEIEGRITLLRFDGAFAQATKADALAKSLPGSWTEVIQAENVAVNCFCQRGVYELDVEE